MQTLCFALLSPHSHFPEPDHKLPPAIPAPSILPCTESRSSRIEAFSLAFKPHSERFGAFCLLAGVSSTNTHTHNVDDSASVRIPVLPGGGRCQEQAVRLRGCVDGVALSAAAGYGRSACVCPAQGLRGCRVAAIVVSFVKL